jgi:arylsulfatase A-like enzyme
VFGLAQNISLYEAAVRTGKQGATADIAHVTNLPLSFRLDDVFRGMLETLSGLQPPFLAYLHTWSPHDPYEPSLEFAGLFDDDWRPVPKPIHVLSRGTRHAEIERERPRYDRYIANVDFEFGRLLDGLQARGLLDQSYVVITSDHGDMLERGDVGHMTPLLYDPVVRVPLIISSPGQRERRDVQVPTSAVDVLPTLVHLSGGEAPAWAEGRALPALGGTEQAERSVFVCEAKDSRPREAWPRASYALRKGKHKLTYYTGYPELGGQDTFELYDIDDDPEELNDLYSNSSATAQDLRAELLERVRTENARYRKAG